MRSSLLALCGCLCFLASALHGQVAWNFSDGTANPSATVANITASPLSATNAGTLAINNTSASSGYTGATGGNNASVTARTGAFATTSSYLEITLTPAAGFAVRVTGLSLGSRSTSTGPTSLAVYSSADNFTAAVSTATVTATSAWTLVNFPTFAIKGFAGTALELRIYAYDGAGTAGAANWRIDDLSVSATAVTPPAITTPPSPATVISGQTASFSVAATGTGALTYQWRKAGVPITGNTSATTANLDLGTVTTSAAGSYDVIVSDTLASRISSPATLTVTKIPATASIGAQTAVYNGTPRAATVTTTPAGLNTTLSYTATSGTTYGPASAPPTSAGTYSVTATINASEYQGSGTGTLTIEKAPATVTFTSLSSTYNGSPRSAVATTVPAGISLAYTYTGTSGTTYGPSTAAPTNAGSYTVVAAINHQNYTGSASGTFVITGNTGSITLGSLTATYTGSPLSPTSTPTPAGQSVTLTFTGINSTVYGPTATPPTAGGSYSVTATFADPNYSGTATETFTISPAAQTIAFPLPPDRLTSHAPFALSAASSSGLPVSFALATASPAVASLVGDTLTLTGNPGSVTIRATQAGNANYLAATAVERTFQVLGSATAPEFILQPVDTAGYLGTPVTLTSFASGAPAPTYRWTRYGVDVPGATNATLTLLSPTADDTGLYQAIATNAAGTASSARVSLTITKRPQTIAFPEPAAAYPPGTSIPLSISASSGLPVTLSLVSGLASLNGLSIVGQGGTVVVRASQAGNATYDAAEPVERTFTFVVGALAPFFSATPADQAVTIGAGVTFHALALGTPAPSYQWQKDGADLPGATNTSLAFAAATPTDAARYTVVATNSLGSARASATLVVRVPPEIVTPPADLTVLAGETATLSIVATGIPAPTYQWRRNGTAISGATAAIFSLTGTTTAQAGRYDVVVTNLLGTVTSLPATLTVNTRDFAGSYFGQFTGTAGPAGEFAVHVRADGTAAFLGHLPAAQTALATTAVRLALNGDFSLSLVTLAGLPDAETNPRTDTTPPTAAAPRPVTLRGTLDSDTHEITGAIPELGVTFSAARSPVTGPASAHAGLYTVALLGSANARGHAIVGADGQAFLLTADATAVDSARGALDASDVFLATSNVGRAVVTLTFARGSVTGTARATNGTTFPLAGAIEALAGTEHLVNLSIRANTSNAAPLITGFVITGAASKQVLIRAAGPALALAPFNVPGVLANPTLQLFRGSTATAQNDNWGTPASNAAAITAAANRAGAFPFRTGSNDAALLTTLAPGAYTVQVGGGNGATLAEVYEVLQSNEAPGARRLINLSARGLVSPASPLIAGLVISGAAPQRVLIRGVGPALSGAPFNVAGALPNPQLTLFRDSTAVKTNDDWFRDAEAAAIRDAATRAGAFALGAQSLDAAMLLYLAPGAYTVQVTSPNPNAAGIALVEVYESAP